uniref:Zinc knuckle CX2CX4HX4C domain-containing protein n=1 Tax=Nelumbo nucifera TaxID=4432 RepID=A0A822Y0D5_NELNU|nr:TPA_asm: hypothetical protein HUJ06_024571 [Nelumbo nucifera]
MDIERVLYEDEDEDEDLLCLRRFLQARVRIETSKALTVSIREMSPSSKSMWFPYQYERLLLFCYRCGLLGHDEGRCNRVPKRQVLDEIIMKLTNQKNGGGEWESIVWALVEDHLLLC